MQIKHIVVLANSVKSSGRCLAGKEVFDNGKAWSVGGWVRPVATKEGGEISVYQMSKALGHDPKLLEVIEIPFAEASPLPFQPENWLIETPLKPGSWKSHDTIEWKDASSLIDRKPEFWHDPAADARRVKEGFPQNMKAPASLYFIQPEKIHSVSAWTQRNTHPEATKPTKGRRVISLTHQGHYHEFEIEDPGFAAKYYPKFPGVDEPKKTINLAKPGETLLCVSLAGLWYGYHYKIAAGILEPPVGGGESK